MTDEELPSVSPKIDTIGVMLKHIGALEKENGRLKELLSFWVNDFYDNFNHSNKYEERHKVLVESEQFLKEI